MTHKKKWLIFAPSGLVVVGFGACLVQWAAHKQQQKAPTSEWVVAGTVALSVFNAGLCLFGRGVAESVLYQVREKDASAATTNNAAPASSDDTLLD